MSPNTDLPQIISPSSSVFSGPTFVNGGTFTQHVSWPSTKGGFDHLLEASAPAAFHNSEQRFDPPKCHPNTRVAVLERITDWVLGANADTTSRQAFMMWLYGSAGAGKSAIAQTIAEKFDSDGGSLLASFFFSRTDPTRDHARHLVATIGYQVALKLPEAKKIIVAAIEHDPLIFSKSLETQFMRLIFEPLQSFMHSLPTSPPPYLIIIDGLDECVDKDVRCSILRLLMTARRQNSIPQVLRFLITSRAELDIRTCIDSQDSETRPSRLALDDNYRPNADIRFFLQAKFKEIKQRHPHRTYIPSEWPSEDIINKLVQTSSGQFIYASTVVKYVSSEAHKPTNQLDIILGLRPAKFGAPFGALDELYTHILSTVVELDLVLQVLSFIFLGKHNRTSTLEEFLGLEDGDIEILFSTLASIVSVSGGRRSRSVRPISAEDRKQKPVLHVKVLHASLEDFLLDESRSKRLYINPAAKHAEYAHRFFLRITNMRSSPSDGLSDLFHHLKRALPTAELYDDITCFSLSSLFENTWISKEFVSYVIRVVFPFLSCIKSLHWEEAAHLHGLQHRQFDQILIHSFADYYTRPSLIFVAAVISLTEGLPVQPTKFLLKHRAHYRLDKIDRKAFEILPILGTFAMDDRFIDYGMVTKYDLGPPTSPELREYHQYLSQFFGDSARSGLCVLTDESYAVAALYLYQFICDGANGDSSADRLSEQLGVLAMLFDRAGKLAVLLDEIAFRHANFRSGIEASEKRLTTSAEMKLVEDAVANYVKRTRNSNIQVCSVQ